MARNPLSFTNRTYLTIRLELDTLYPNQPSWFKDMLAGLFDIAHWYIDARAQNLLITSAYTEEAIRDLASYLDYYPNNRSAASGTVQVTSSVAGPVIYPAADLKFRIKSPQGDVMVYESLTDLNIPAGFTGNVVIYNLETRSAIPIGTSDGSTEWQEFVINDTNILTNPEIAVTVNAFSWTQEDNLVNSLAADKHFRALYKPSGLIGLLFGNGTYGAIPPAFPVLATYRVGGGTLGNVPMAGSEITYIGGNPNITAVSILSNFTGGSEGDNLEKTRALAPAYLRINYRTVTEDDYAKQSVKYDASIIMAKAFAGLYGEGTVGVHIIPAGGGNPSAGLKTTLQADLISRSPLGNVDVRVRNPGYVTQAVTAAIKMRAGYLFATYQNYATLAIRLIISEVSKEVIDIYDEDGIDAVITYVNTKWGYTFAAADATELDNIIQRRKRDGVNDWGNSVNPNDIISALDDLTGVDYATVTVPAAIVSVPFHRITTDGVVVVNNIP